MYDIKKEKPFKSFFFALKTGLSSNKYLFLDFNQLSPLKTKTLALLYLVWFSFAQCVITLSNMFAIINFLFTCNEDEVDDNIWKL